MVDQRTTRVALVGSGYIADAHLTVLQRVPHVSVVALCDPQRARAERLAVRFGGPKVFASLDELLAAGGIDVVHVLVPPELHFDIARRCLLAGLDVLVEKPMALRLEDVSELTTLANTHGRVLGVNHNQTCHPAVRALHGHLAAGRLGHLEHVSLVHNVPLRQLQTGDFNHFLFRTEANILFEQGVHLFSVVHDLLGDCLDVAATVGPPRVLPHGARFFAEWDLALRCTRGTASVRMAFGRGMPEMTIQALGSDGAATLDLLRGSCELRRKTRWLEVLDHARNLAAQGLHLLHQSCTTVLGYGLALFGLRPPDELFLRGMQRSLDGFHAAVRARSQAPGSPMAAHAVVSMCLRAAAAAKVSTETLAVQPLPTPGPARPGEVVVLGGTGFLGRRCVVLLARLERPTTLVVRRPDLLPTAWRARNLRVFAGDAADPAVLTAALRGADAVLHLATVAGDDPGQVEAAMSSAVQMAGAACRLAGVRRLVYVSGAAALYLGGSRAVAGDAGTDPRPRRRAAYARGKIAAERALRAQGLDVVIVRPGIVLGSDGPREHSGIGLWVRDNHCVGWGRGLNPLPLVLADDCAVALVAALTAPAAAGKSYNLAGDVRLTAREYLQELRLGTGRDCHFHSLPLTCLWLQEVGKYCIKLLARRPREWPSLRDLRSRSFRAPLDCSDSKQDLGFAPESDRRRFLDRLFRPGVGAP